MASSLTENNGAVSMRLVRLGVAGHLAPHGKLHS